MTQVAGPERVVAAHAPAWLSGSAPAGYAARQGEARNPLLTGRAFDLNAPLPTVLTADNARKA
jgi:hypothetical protein